MDTDKDQEAMAKELNQTTAILRSTIGSNLRDLRLEAERQRQRTAEGKFTLEDLADELTRSGHP